MNNITTPPAFRIKSICSNEIKKNFRTLRLISALSIFSLINIVQPTKANWEIEILNSDTRVVGVKIAHMKSPPPSRSSSCLDAFNFFRSAQWMTLSPNKESHLNSLTFSDHRSHPDDTCMVLALTVRKMGADLAEITRLSRGMIATTCSAAKDVGVSDSEGSIGKNSPHGEEVFPVVYFHLPARDLNSNTPLALVPDPLLTIQIKGVPVS